MTSPSPTHPPEKPTSQTLVQALGVNRSHPPLMRWPPDAHLACAALLALPVLAVLGWLAGPHLRIPIGVWAWVSLVLLQPLLEELVFRGLLQGQALTWLARQGKTMQLGPITLANAVVTLAFVALHLRAQPLAWALAVAAPSLVFGHLRERFQSVWPAVFLHALYNAGFGATAWLARG